MTKSTYVEELRAERDELRRVAEMANRVRGNAMEELERVKKQAAAMREALKEMRRVAVCGGNSPDGPDVACAVDELLRSSDASHGYISREQVKPLLEALEELDNMLAMRGPGDNPYAVVRRALEHARNL